MTSPFVSLWTSQSVALVLLWTASIQRLATTSCGLTVQTATRRSTRIRHKQTGDAGDTVLRETGEKNECPAILIRKSLPLAQGHKLLHIVRRGRFCSEYFSECRFGGADAGSAAANVNLIQPREKRKAFNAMKRGLDRTCRYCHTTLGPAPDPTAPVIMYHRRKLQQGVGNECNSRCFNVLAQAYFIAATK
jgi:hypothetical protein